LLRFASGAVGTLECSRVARGPRAEYVVEVYGTRGSVRWNFERMGELLVDTGAGGYTTRSPSRASGSSAGSSPPPGPPWDTTTSRPSRPRSSSARCSPASSTAPAPPTAGPPPRSGPRSRPPPPTAGGTRSPPSPAPPTTADPSPTAQPSARGVTAPASDREELAVARDERRQHHRDDQAEHERPTAGEPRSGGHRGCAPQRRRLEQDEDESCHRDVEEEPEPRPLRRQSRLPAADEQEQRREPGEAAGVELDAARRRALGLADDVDLGRRVLDSLEDPPALVHRSSEVGGRGVVVEGVGRAEPTVPADLELTGDGARPGLLDGHARDLTPRERVEE